MTKSSKAVPLGGVLLLLYVAGTLVWAVYATASVVFPAAPLVHLQALWGDGRYGVKLTFACAWLCMLAPPVVFALLAVPVVQRLSPRTTYAAFDAADVEVLEVHPRPPYPIYAAGLGALTAALIALLVRFPQAFVPVPFIGKLALLLTPLAAVAAAGLLAQSLAVDHVVVTQVEAIDSQPQPGDACRTRHDLLADGHTWTITAQTAARLRPGMRVVLAGSPLCLRLLRLAVASRL